ncbi:MAG TPA: hypothetical protein VE178_14030 [Silvibacterium sp.]|nr:hypothetical protein [Silvibacterium sp.]
MDFISSFACASARILLLFETQGNSIQNVAFVYLPLNALPPGLDHSGMPAGALLDGMQGPNSLSYSLLGSFFGGRAIASSIMLWFTREQSALYCFSFTFLAMLFAGLVGLTLLGWNRAMFVNLAPKVFWQDKLWILFDSLPDRQRIPKPSYSA